MKKSIVNSWSKLPNGIQVCKFENASTAFKYAEEEYMPYGYDTAVYATDIKILVITMQQHLKTN